MSDKQYFKVKKTVTVGKASYSYELQHPTDLFEHITADVVTSIYGAMLDALENYEFEVESFIEEEENT